MLEKQIAEAFDSALQEKMCRELDIKPAHEEQAMENAAKKRMNRRNRNYKLTANGGMR